MKKLLLGSSILTMLLFSSISASAAVSPDSGVNGCKAGSKHHCKRYEL
ncbi:MAG: hypothetical protein ACQEWU_06830 [Bacillota bacterium]|nr:MULTISPECIES: hypothetical protein [Bacillaceae]MCC2251353.1 hypothetical protein [Virgibacillus sp. AGTR]MDY7043813.1 hypothetical protein [Virgibacillus sp. M23]QRZ19466.1 hypothetical protein JUJ52_07285 [Virgibacillus sp. AGTR]